MLHGHRLFDHLLLSELLRLDLRFDELSEHFLIGTIYDLYLSLSLLFGHSIHVHLALTFLTLAIC